MNKTLSEHRLRAALSNLNKAKRGGSFTVADAEEILGLSKRSVSLILSELSEGGSIVRTGRGTYSFSEKPTPVISYETLPEDSRKLYRALESKGLEFALSCLDILADYTHLTLRRYPHFCWVQTGSEDWAMEVIEESGFAPLRDPNRDQLNIALDLTRANELTVIRKTTMFYTVAAGLASMERATSHSLRHSLALWADREGISVRVIRSLLGHSSLASTNEYLRHVAEWEKRSAVEALRFPLVGLVPARTEGE